MSTEAIQAEKTPIQGEKDKQNGFFSSLLCFCRWGPDKSDAADKGSPTETEENKRNSIKTRVPRVAVSPTVDDSASQYESNLETSSQYTDVSGAGSLYSCDATLPNMYGELAGSRRKGKKKKKRSNSSSSVRSGGTGSSGGSGGDHAELDLNEIRREFIIIMSTGMNLLAATAVGSTRIVTVVTDGNILSWGLPKQKPIMSIPLKNISCVKRGMPTKLQKSFLACDVERSFNLVLHGDSKAATFLAPTSLERDALVHGFETLLLTLEQEKPEGDVVEQQAVVGVEDMHHTTTLQQMVNSCSITTDTVSGEQNSL